MPLVMTVEEVAALLRVSKETVYAEVQAGFLPARKVGRAWRFFRPAVIEYLYARDPHTDEPDPTAGGPPAPG